MIHVSFDKGTILVRGNVRVPNSTWDSRSGGYRAFGLYYRDIIAFLNASGFAFTDDVLNLVPTPTIVAKTMLREYQEKAIAAWQRAGQWGVVVLPTGSGKTHVALKAIEMAHPAIVIVPTLDLLEQWKTRVEDEFGIEAGIYCGDEHRLGPVTIATYDTAYIRAAELGNRFRLAVFDEVHHLPSPGYSAIAEMFTCTSRLGMTATYEREDGKENLLTGLVGGKVFEMKVDELEGVHLANYDLKKIKVHLLPDEEDSYRRDYDAYRKYLGDNRIMLRTPRDFERLIMRSGRDPGAREAIMARHRARVTALNSRSKIIELAAILGRHTEPDDRVIIFTEYNDLVYAISREFLLPFITYTTPKGERSANLARFRSGEYRAIVTSKVLDEGVDVPDANIGIILSGSGSRREFVQRLGRILRKKGDKKAILYEIVSRGTMEESSSRKRNEVA